MPQHDLNADPSVLALAPVLEQVHAVSVAKITSAAGYQSAAVVLKSIKGTLATIEDARTRITKPLNDSLKEVNAQAKAAAAPFLADEALIKRAMIKYSDEQDALREAEQRRANEAADKEQKRLKAIADAAAAKGQDGKAEKFEARASAVVAPTFSHVSAPKVAGVSVPLVWDHEIVNPKLVPCDYHDINETRIRKVVQAMQGNTNIPGVRVFQKKRISSTSS
jgi:hypothetical protein